jgi:hypothetical protein
MGERWHDGCDLRDEFDRGDSGQFQRDGCFIHANFGDRDYGDRPSGAGEAVRISITIETTFHVYHKED